MIVVNARCGWPNAVTMPLSVATNANPLMATPRPVIQARQLDCAEVVGAGRTVEVLERKVALVIMALPI